MRQRRNRSVPGIITVPGTPNAPKTSAILVALVLFSGICGPARASLPLTETIGTLPEGQAGFSLREELYTGDGTRRREYAGVTLGVLPWFNMGYYFTYLHSALSPGGQGEIGDSFLRMWFYTGDYLGERLHTGIAVQARMPTGRNVYKDATWRNLAFGNNELKIGPVIQLDFDRIYLHGNLFYALREKDREGFYNRLRLNPLDGEFYTTCMGLNPSARDSFLQRRLLDNDYVAAACAINTSRVYPFVPFAEAYLSRGISPDRATRDLRIEGSAPTVLLLGTGFRWFFTQGAFAGAYVLISPLHGTLGVRESLGVEMAAQF
jgi:hypothetical protein